MSIDQKAFNEAIDVLAGEFPPESGITIEVLKRLCSAYEAAKIVPAEHNCRYKQALDTAHKVFAAECDKMKALPDMGGRVDFPDNCFPGCKLDARHKGACSTVATGMDECRKEFETWYHENAARYGLGSFKSCEWVWKAALDTLAMTRESIGVDIAHALADELIGMTETEIILGKSILRNNGFQVGSETIDRAYARKVLQNRFPAFQAYEAAVNEIEGQS